jgi:hypothetical protein
MAKNNFSIYRPLWYRFASQYRAVQMGLFFPMPKKKTTLTVDSYMSRGAIFHICPKCFQQVMMTNKAVAPTNL